MLEIRELLSIFVISGASSEADASIRVLAMFLQHLPRHNPIWYWMFMQVLASIPRGLGLRDVLNKDFDEDLGEFITVSET